MPSTPTQTLAEAGHTDLHNNTDSKLAGVTLPDVAVSKTGSEVLTNKTLTSPVINTQLTGTAIVDEDDMASNSAVKVPTQQSVKAYVDAGSASTTGWTTDTDTWVYVSATSFKITGKNVASKFTPGVKIKWTQTTAHYGYVLSSAFSTDTTVTIVTNTSYVVENAVITAAYYTYQSPADFPHWFNVAATTFDVATLDNGSGGQPTITTNRLSINDRVVTIHLMGSGVKAGTGDYWSCSVTGYPTMANMPDSSAVCSTNCYVNEASATRVGTVKYVSSAFYFSFNASITDNHTISSFGGFIIYEM